jgi:DNA-binding transcriptional regulator YiaG
VYEEDQTVPKDIEGALTRHKKGGAGAPKSRKEPVEQVLPEYDATSLIGLRVVVRDAAILRINDWGEETVELPKVRELAAAAAVKRCLMPIRLKGQEMKAIRKILGMTMAELAKKLDERAAPETVARWESDAQPMGGYAEKVFRLIVCETLSQEALGVPYRGGMIADLRVVDYARVEGGLEIPYIEMCFAKVREHGEVTDTWLTKMAA